MKNTNTSARPVKYKGATHSAHRTRPGFYLLLMTRLLFLPPIYVYVLSSVEFVYIYRLLLYYWSHCVTGVYLKRQANPVDGRVNTILPVVHPERHVRRAPQRKNRRRCKKKNKIFFRVISFIFLLVFHSRCLRLTIIFLCVPFLNDCLNTHFLLTLLFFYLKIIGKMLFFLSLY